VKNYSDRILAMSAITNCNIFGEGNALNEIANAINNRGVTKIALLGYSHGGGTVYNLSKRLYYDGTNCIWYGDVITFSDIIHNSYELIYTSYIDAIRNDKWSRMLPEINRPIDTSYHVNQYQQNTSYPILGDLNGEASSPLGDIDEDRSSWLDPDGNQLTHSTIDDSVQIKDVITNTFEEKVPR
jgi:hypothetical protein